MFQNNCDITNSIIGNYQNGKTTLITNIIARLKILIFYQCYCVKEL